MEQNRKKQLIIQTNEACSNMIVGIRQLRLSVLDLFTKLADNGPSPSAKSHHQLANPQTILSHNSKLYHQQILSNLQTSHTLCTSSTPPLRIQKQQEQQQQVDLLQYVNQMISTITALTRGLDQDISILSQNSSLISPGETINLGMDSSLDKHNLYMDLCDAYKTFSKLHDHSAHCCALLHQQSLKRVYKSRESRAESIVATFNPYNYKICSPKGSVWSVLDSCLKLCENMEGTYSQPFGLSTGVLQISVSRVLKAVLVMRGIVIDAVIVKAYHESFASKACKSGGGLTGITIADSDGASMFVNPDEDIDLWSDSRYSAFRKLTHQANAAVLHFQYPTYPEIAARSFLSWFNSYSDLFAATCSRCNQKLRKFMPPICRDFSSGFYPHHDSLRNFQDKNKL